MTELLTELQTQAGIQLPADIQAINPKSVVDEANDLTITGQSELDRAAELRVQWKAWLSDKFFDAIDKEIKGRYLLHKAACALRAYFAAPLESGIAILDRKVLDFDREQRRRQEQERIRVENEAKKKQEEEAAIAAALAAEAGASPAEVKEIQRQVEMAPPIFNPAPVYRPPTISIRQNWIGEVTDREKFFRAAVKLGLFNLLEVNQSAVNAMAKSQKQYAKLDGMRFYDAGNVAGKRGA